MIYSYIRRNGTLDRVEGIAGLEQSDRSALAWVDLLEPTPEEQAAAVRVIGSGPIALPARALKGTWRYHEDALGIDLHVTFLKPEQKGWVNEPVYFGIKGDVLLTQRATILRSFAEVERRRRAGQLGATTAQGILLSVFSARIDLDADLIEAFGQQISAMNKEISIERVVGKDMLLRIDRELENAMGLRQSIVDKQRALTVLSKSEHFPASERDTISALLRNITSLLEHLAFGFERLEFLQNTAHGLVNIEQNRVIKIFTVATVIFMPPTLIASLYGMNFRRMPELDKAWGYPMAIALMLLSSGATLLFFRRRGWL